VPRIVYSRKPRAVQQAAEALHRGELVVLPTDTVYGIAARPDRPGGLRLLFEVKGRPKEFALPLLVRDLEQASTVGVITGPARRLAEKLWPGPLTIVVSRVEGFDADLGGDGRTVGLRMPDHAVALELLHQAGPLATTSANRSGEPTPPTVDEIAAIFTDRVALYLDDGRAAGEEASTVLSLSEAQPRILRSGPIHWDEILRVLRAD
jgi:tRNA threonylcarbamoyl adenosine modification protein (Sua5/YciO/YrdC/YwlC family)